MKSAQTVHTIGLPARNIANKVFRNGLFLLICTVSLMSCAQQSQLRYQSLSNEVIDTEMGHTGSEARMEVTEDVVVSATTVVEEDMDMLRTEVIVTNTTGRYMRLLYRGCPIQIQIFEDEERSGEPLYDSFIASDNQCERREVVRTLFMLEDLELTEYTHMDRAFMEDLPDGRYYVNAVVRPNGIPLDVPAGEILLGVAPEDS